MESSNRIGRCYLRRVVSAVVLLNLVPGLQLQLKPQTNQRGSVNANSRQTEGRVFLHSGVDSRASKMSTASLSELRTHAASAEASVTKEKTSGGVATYVVMNIEFKTAAGRRVAFTDRKVSRVSGAYVLTVFGKFADVFIETDAAWNAIYANPNVLRAEPAGGVTAPPPPEPIVSPLVSQAIPENIVRGGFRGLTGKNVIIAILDTGIDFRHPDFVAYDSAGRPASRIKYLWDTATEYGPGRGQIAPFKFPNGASIGTLYTNEQLTNELRSNTVRIPPTDVDGHGTACASIAAGNGNADMQEKGLKRKEVKGVAPGAELIGIRLGYNGFENAYLLNAVVEWLEKVASTTPLVISGSFGGHYSGHDGQKVAERHLNARLPLTKTGRAIVFAAGNEGNHPMHASVRFSSTPRLVSWTAKEDTLVTIYFDSNDKSIAIIPTQTTPLGQNMLLELNPITNQLQAQIMVKTGAGGLFFENTSGGTSEAHLYFLNQFIGAFAPQNVTYSHLVGTPGTMENAITVGSYDWNDNFHSGGQSRTLFASCRGADGNPMSLEIGWLSCYSSPGPNRRVGAKPVTMKPDIVAPGQWYAASYARIAGEESLPARKAVDSTGYYAAMNGTSAATPYTSGVIALMFEKKPSLTVGQVKALLTINSTKSALNPSKGAVPNINWGYGKLDIAAINRIFDSIEKDSSRQLAGL